MNRHRQTPSIPQPGHPHQDRPPPAHPRQDRPLHQRKVTLARHPSVKMSEGQRHRDPPRYHGPFHRVMVLACPVTIRPRQPKNPHPVGDRVPQPRSLSLVVSVGQPTEKVPRDSRFICDFPHLSTPPSPPTLMPVITISVRLLDNNSASQDSSSLILQRN